MTFGVPEPQVPSGAGPRGGRCRREGRGLARFYLSLVGAVSTNYQRLAKGLPIWFVAQLLKPLAKGLLGSLRVGLRGRADRIPAKGRRSQESFP